MNQTNNLPAHHPPRRISDLRSDQWLLLGETALSLAVTSLAIALLPFRRVVRLATGKPPNRHASTLRPVDVGEVVWAVEAVAWRVPWRTVCFQKGLTLHLLLRRRGIASILHYGVGKDDGGFLKAHVWISLDGGIVQGGNVADRFHCLATYSATNDAD